MSVKINLPYSMQFTLTIEVPFAAKIFTEIFVMFPIDYSKSRL